MLSGGLTNLATWQCVLTTPPGAFCGDEASVFYSEVGGLAG